MDEQGFELVGNTLKVSVDLDLDAEEGFKKAAEKLLASSDKELYLDLSEVGFIGSSFFGQMFVLNYKVKKDGRTLTLRTPRRLMSIMELLGLPQLLQIEVVDPEPAESSEDTGATAEEEGAS